MRFVAVIMLLCLTGCEYSSKTKVAAVNEKYPVLKIPPKPVLKKITSAELAPLAEPTKEKLIFNSDALQLYAAHLAALSRQYNNYARWKNSGSADAFSVEIEAVPQTEPEPTKEKAP